MWLFTYRALAALLLPITYLCFPIACSSINTNSTTINATKFDLYGNEKSINKSDILTGTNATVTVACHNGGSLLTDGNCKCSAQFFGERCQHVPCLNGGFPDDSLRCSCPKGYAGYRCELIERASCQNGGVYNGNMSRCDCPPEYTGTRCDQQECKHGIHAPANIRMFQRCICDIGHTGVFCDQLIICINGDISNTTNKCECWSTYDGPECDRCADNHTMYHDKCLNATQHRDVLRQILFDETPDPSANDQNTASLNTNVLSTPNETLISGKITPDKTNPINTGVLSGSLLSTIGWILGIGLVCVLFVLCVYASVRMVDNWYRKVSPSPVAGSVEASMVDAEAGDGDARL